MRGRWLQRTTRLSDSISSLLTDLDGITSIEALLRKGWLGVGAELITRAQLRYVCGDHGAALADLRVITRRRRLAEPFFHGPMTRRALARHFHVQIAGEQLPHLTRQPIVGIFQNLRQSPHQAAQPLANHDAEFGQQATDLVRLGGALLDQALAGAVHSGEPVGLLAYDGGTPVGWVAVAPRYRYPRLLRSTTLHLAPDDEPGVWSVTCFYIHRRHRRSGVAAALLAAAVDYAAGTVVEGYPVDTGGDRRPSGDLFTGTVALFTRAGFHVHDRPAGGRRVVMRR